MVRVIITNGRYKFNCYYNYKKEEDILLYLKTLNNSVRDIESGRCSKNLLYLYIYTHMCVSYVREKDRDTKLVNAKWLRIRIQLTCTKMTPIEVIVCAGRRPVTHHAVLAVLPSSTHHRDPFNLQLQGQKGLLLNPDRSNIEVLGAGAANGFPRYASRVKPRAFGWVRTVHRRWPRRRTTWRLWL